MRVCTNEEMRKLDNLTIEKYGTPGKVLMENAGMWVAIVASQMLKNEGGEKIVVLCGGGNNGGDGFVAARLLKKMGHNVEIVLVAKPDSLKGDALLNYNRLSEVGLSCINFTGNIPKADIYIDALLGTGISGAPRGNIANAIKTLNEVSPNALVVAVDIPSGVNGNNGTIAGESVIADATVTFGFPKMGHFIHPGRANVGNLFVSDIGIDRRATAEVPISCEVTTLSDMSLLLPERPPDGHKGTFGKGLIVAGSAGMTGAVAMAGISLLRSGAGLCYAAVPRSLVDTVDAAATEVVVLPMPEVRKKRCHTLRALGELHKYARNVDAIAVGPGIGRHIETAEMVRRFLTRIQKPVVIDADALNALVGHLNDTIPQITAPSVMTPHFAELARILEITTEQVSAERIEKATKWAKILFTTLVIKGNPTIIADGSEPIWLNPTGNDGMATAGSGDVLTGLIAGFLAQGLSPLNAARVGVYVHGLAGDIAAGWLTNRATVATDIMQYIPEAMRIIEEAGFSEHNHCPDLNVTFSVENLGANMEMLRKID